jgi:hypothetical protein
MSGLGLDLGVLRLHIVQWRELPWRHFGYEHTHTSTDWVHRKFLSWKLRYLPVQ